MPYLSALRGVITTRRYTNSRLPLPYLYRPSLRLKEPRYIYHVKLQQKSPAVSKSQFSYSQNTKTALKVNVHGQLYPKFDHF